MNRNLALIIAGQGISGLGDYLYSQTLLIWIFALAPGSAAVSVVTAMQFLPILLIGPFAGIFIDRWNRRQTIIAANLGQAVVALLPLIVPTAIRLPAIYASVSLIFTLGTFTTSANSGLLQVVVESKQLPQAVSFNQTAFTMSSILGFFLATPLYLAVGPAMALLIDAASFLLSALCLSLVRAPREVLHPYAFRKDKSEGRGVAGVFRDLSVGFRFVITTRLLLMVCVVVCIGLLGAGALQPLGIVFLSRQLHMKSAFAGFLSSALGIGTLVGLMGAGLIARRFAPRHLFIVSILLLGVSVIIYSFQTVFLLALIVNFIIGTQQGGLQLGYLSILLGITPETMIGRVQSVVQMCVAGMGIVSASLAGYLGQVLPVNRIFTISGSLIVMAGLFGWLILRASTKKGAEYTHNSVLL
jgi:MFS family permease